MVEQVGWRGLIDRLQAEAPRYNKLLPQLPRLVHKALTQLTDLPPENQVALLNRLIEEQARTNRLLGLAIYFGVGVLGGMVLIRLLGYLH
jgi:ubiquinone biosynthesis protein